MACEAAGAGADVGSSADEVAQTSDPTLAEAGFVVRVELGVNYPAANEDVVLAWSDGAGSSTHPSGDSGVVVLERGFETRAAAEQSGLAVEVSRGGMAVGSIEPDWDACGWTRPSDTS